MMAFRVEEALRSLGSSISHHLREEPQSIYRSVIVRCIEGNWTHIRLTESWADILVYTVERTAHLS